MLSNVRENVHPQEQEIELIIVPDEEEPVDQEVVILDRQHDQEVQIVFDDGPPPRDTNLTREELEEMENTLETADDRLLVDITRTRTHGIHRGDICIGNVTYINYKILSDIV